MPYMNNYDDRNLFLKKRKSTVKKCKMVSVFTKPDVNTREVGRTRDKRSIPAYLASKTLKDLSCLL